MWWLFQKKYFGFLLVTLTVCMQTHQFFVANFIIEIYEEKTGCSLPTVENGRVLGINNISDPPVVAYYCDEGYGLFPDTKTVACVGEQWDGILPKCIKTCPVRLPELVHVICDKDRIQVDCHEPLVDGTKQYMLCKPRYTDDNPFNKPSVECNAACGQVAPRGKPLIVNGLPVNAGEFPWHVAIYRKKSEDLQYKYNCGGSIINPYIVLTAAHCFTDENGTLFNVNEFSLAAGKYFREYNSTQDIFAQKRQIQRVIIPPGYKGFLSNYSPDLALVIVSKTFELTNVVQYVCLDWNNLYENEQLQTNVLGTVPGWGHTIEGRELAIELKKLTVPYISREVCIASVPRDFVRFVTPDKFCTGYRNEDKNYLCVCMNMDEDGTSICSVCLAKNLNDGNLYLKQFGRSEHFPYFARFWSGKVTVLGIVNFLLSKSVVETYSGKCKREYDPLDVLYSASTCINGTWDRPPLFCVPEYGEPVPKDTIVIIDGEPIKIPEFPWLSGIYLEHPKYKTFSLTCSGSIISTKLVLTSATCVADPVMEGKNVYVPAGKYYQEYESVLDILAQTRKVSNVEYAHRIHEGDIANLAIVIVDRPFILNNFIRPVCLDIENTIAQSVVEGLVPDWKFFYQEETFKGFFKRVLVPFEKYDNYCSSVLHSPPEDNFCFLLPEDKQICNVEGGGGIFAYKKKQEKFYIIGVLDYINAQKCYNYTMYTNVTHYLNFIKQTEEKYRVW